MAVHGVISELNRLKAEGFISAYAVGGAVAAHAYIEPFDTEDLDVFIVTVEKNTGSLDPFRDINADLISHGAVWDGPYLVIDEWPVQLLPPANPLYEDAITNANTVDFGHGVFGQIMGPEHLAAIALQTHRGKDYVRVDEFIRRGAVNMPVLKAMIDKYGLTESWSRFQTLFPETHA